MFAQLRADLHNGSEMLQRTDKRPWTAQDFGADAPPAKPRHPRSTLTPETLRARVIQMWGPDGKGHAVENVVATLQGTGQAIPKAG